MFAPKTLLPLLLGLAACSSTKSEQPVEVTPVVEPAAGGTDDGLSDQDREQLQALGYLGEEAEDTAAALDDEQLQGQLADLQDRIAKAQKRNAEITEEMAGLDSSDLIGDRGDALRTELEAIQAQIAEMRSELGSLVEGM